MAPPFASQKRRGGSDANPSMRNVRSRIASRNTTSQSNIRSDSRYTTVSRRSSTESLQGRGIRRAPPRHPSTRSERPVSVASSRTFASDDRSVTTTEQPAHDDFGADVDQLNEVVMAVNLTDRGTVGCAYYVARDEKLYFMEDVKLGGADIVDSC